MLPPWVLWMPTVDGRSPGNGGLLPEIDENPQQTAPRTDNPSHRIEGAPTFAWS